MFGDCLGHTIIDVRIEYFDNGMWLSSNKDINMSDEVDIVRQIRFDLKGGTALVASGLIDWFAFKYIRDFGEPVKFGSDIFSPIWIEKYLMKSYLMKWSRPNMMDYDKYTLLLR